MESGSRYVSIVPVLMESGSHYVWHVWEQSSDWVIFLAVSGQGSSCVTDVWPRAVREAVQTGSGDVGHSPERFSHAFLRQEVGQRGVNRFKIDRDSFGAVLKKRGLSWAHELEYVILWCVGVRDVLWWFVKVFLWWYREVKSLWWLMRSHFWVIEVTVCFHRV